MEVIKYNGSNYPAKKIKVGTDEVLISCTFLQDKLFDSNGNYKDAEAKYVDELVYFYLTADDFNKSTNEIKQIIENG